MVSQTDPDKPAAKTYEDKRRLAVDNYIANTVVKPVEGYSWLKAMTDASYSYSYAHGQGQIVKRACQQEIDRRIKEIQKERRYNLKDWEEELQDTYKDCVTNNDRTNRIRAVENGIKLNGGFIDRSINLNADIPQDPVLYRQWLKDELTRLDAGDKVVDAYKDTQTAIAQRY